MTLHVLVLYILLLVHPAHASLLSGRSIPAPALSVDAAYKVLNNAPALSLDAAYKVLNNAPALSVDAAYKVLNNVLPPAIVQLFTLSLDEVPSGLTFTYESSTSSVSVVGSTPVAITAGVYDYLKTYHNASLSWVATGGDSVPSSIVLSEVKSTTKTSPYQHIYYNNVCTYGYSGMWWWDWKRWEYELDRMAMNGITTPLLALGQEFVWNQVWLDLGLSQADIDEWNAGPAYAAWFYMGNLKGWAGPVSLDYQERTRQLQHRIMDKARGLGMTPVLPSFSGFVPDSFKAAVPDAVVFKSSGWNGFEPVAYIDPTSEEFAAVTSSFVKKYCTEYTCNRASPNYFAADLYNELVPPQSDPGYLHNVSSSVYAAMKAADSNAVWVTQGWMFYNDQSFWHREQVKAFVGGVPQDKLIVIDLNAEEKPIWSTTDSFYGQPFIYSTIFNFGGRSGIYGRLEEVTTGIHSSLNARSMRGLGAAPEAIETNPLDYDFLWDHVFHTELHDPKSYVERYVDRRYKGFSDEATEHLKSAWEILRVTAYDFSGTMQGAVGSVFTLRPAFNMNRTGCCAPLALYYNPARFLEALGELIAAMDGDKGAIKGLETQTSFHFDVLNVAIQVLSNEALRVYRLMNAGNHVTAIQENKDYFLHLLDMADRILLDMPERMLGFWIKQARLAGKSREEADQMEYNARLMVTLWGDRNSSLHEYSLRMWAGLLSTFYRERWMMFFDAVAQGDFVQGEFDDKVKAFEVQWTRLTVADVILESTPHGGGLDVVRQVWEMLRPSYG